MGESVWTKGRNEEFRHVGKGNGEILETLRREKEKKTVGGREEAGKGRQGGELHRTSFFHLIRLAGTGRVSRAKSQLREESSRRERRLRMTQQQPGRAFQKKTGRTNLTMKHKATATAGAGT